jgi:hypothetical protein
VTDNEKKGELAEAIAARLNDPGSWAADVALASAIRAACREVSREEIVAAMTCRDDRCELRGGKHPHVWSATASPPKLERCKAGYRGTYVGVERCNLSRHGDAQRHDSENYSWLDSSGPHIPDVTALPEAEWPVEAEAEAKPKERCKAGYRRTDGTVASCALKCLPGSAEPVMHAGGGCSWLSTYPQHIPDVLAEAQGAKEEADTEECLAGPGPATPTVECEFCDGWGEYLINPREPKIRPCGACGGEGTMLASPCEHCRTIQAGDPSRHFRGCPERVERKEAPGTACAMPGCAGRATVFDIGSPRGYCQACVSRHMAECLFGSRAPAPAERAASLREALVAIEEADASDPALVARAALDADDASVSEPSLSNEAKAIASAGFRVAPDYHGVPTLWCVECGRDSGFHMPACSKVAADIKRHKDVAQRDAFGHVIPPVVGRSAAPEPAPPPPVEEPAKWGCSRCGYPVEVSAQGCCTKCGLDAVRTPPIAKPAPEQTAPERITVYPWGAAHGEPKWPWSLRGTTGGIDYVHPRIVSALESELATTRNNRDGTRAYADEIEKALSTARADLARVEGLLQDTEQRRKHFATAYTELTETLDRAVREAIERAWCDAADHLERRLHGSAEVKEGITELRTEARKRATKEGGSR